MAKKYLIIVISFMLTMTSFAITKQQENARTTPHYLKTKTGQIEYYRLGSGNPPIVLISGYAANVGSWNLAFLSPLSAHHEVIIFNNRNVGGSHATTTAYTSQDLANDTDTLIRQLHLQKPTVVGISMGGMIAQQLAVLHPEDLSHLVLINTAIAGNTALPPDNQVQQIITHTPQGKIHRFILALHLMAPPLWWIKVIHEIKTDRFIPANQHTLGITPNTLQQQQNLVRTWLQDNKTAKQIATLQLPVLILNGEKDALIPPKNSEILAKTIPHAELKRWPNGGHMMTYQFPNSIAEAILAFVDHAS